MLLIALVSFSFGQQQAPKTPPKPFELTVDSIMRGPELIGEEPRAIRWSADGKTLQFVWKSPEEVGAHGYAVNADGTHFGPVDDASEAQIPAGVTSPDGRTLAYLAGKVVMVRSGNDAPRAIPSSDEPKSNLTWMADGRHVAYAVGNREILLAIDSGEEAELASVYSPGQATAPQRTPPTTDPTVPTEDTPSRKALAAEQTELFPGAGARRGGGGGGFGGGRGQRGGRGPNGVANAGTQGDHKIELKENQRAGGFNPSPDGVHVAIPVFETLGQSRSTVVPNYITGTGYTEDINSYPKVGDIHNRSTLAVTGANGKAAWLVPPDSAGSRDYSVRQSQWSSDGKYLVSEIATNDHKDRWIVRVDPDTAKSTVLFADHSEAWLGGPGRGGVSWLPDHRRLYFESERDGWSHLYTVDVTNGDVRQLTSGPFEVSGVHLSKDGTRFFFTSSEGSLFRRHFDVVSAEGGTRTRLLPPGKDDTLDGDTAVTLSPDESHAGYLRSWVNHPPELFVAGTSPGDKETKVTESPTAEWRSFKWTTPDLVQIPASDGVNVPAHFYRPAHFRRGGPAVIFVHGAGYLQNVHDWWKSAYYREYMFHHVLVAHGVAVLDIDYRASAGYGRDWRTAVYRFMGGRDLDDQVDGASWLVKKQGVNANRIGIYGGSYGGFLTLMAMFTKPGVFASGAALRPVSDWANYNDGYTSDILNLPQDDKEAYRRSSPIYHAEGLSGTLLICHGVVDTNVHYQDTVRLVQRLIDLKKENWSVAFYPMEDHTFSSSSSWADEYRRILKLFQETLHF